VNAFVFMSEPRAAARTFRDLAGVAEGAPVRAGGSIVTAAFPKPETYGLVANKCAARRCPFLPISPKVPPRGKADKARYMNIAEGSLEECRYYLILAHDLDMATPTA